MTITRNGRKVDPVQQGGATGLASPIYLELPAPPSANRIWRNTADGTRKSKAYVDWLGHAGWKLRSQAPGQMLGPVLIIVSVEHIKTADIDNRIKALFDLLVDEGVIEDDRMVVGFAAAWAPAANKMARLMILPAASIAVQFQLAPDGAHGGWFLSNAPNPEISDGSPIAQERPDDDG